ncbi:hypothetical protein ACOSQ2_031933 [Xanthoceras sorbifolium]
MLHAESSSMIHKSDSMVSALPTSLQPPQIAKSMNFNLPIKLNRDNYINWKALVMPAIRAIKLKDFITGERICPSKFVEYDLVVVLVSQQSSVTFHEAQYMLMIHEQRIEHLNSSVQVEVPPSANFAAVLLMVVEETTTIEANEAGADGIMLTGLLAKSAVVLGILQLSVTTDMTEMPIKILPLLVSKLHKVLCKFILKLVLLQISLMVLLLTIVNRPTIQILFNNIKLTIIRHQPLFHLLKWWVILLGMQIVELPATSS